MKANHRLSPDSWACSLENALFFVSPAYFEKAKNPGAMTKLARNKLFGKLSSAMTSVRNAEKQ